MNLPLILTSVVLGVSLFLTPAPLSSNQNAAKIIDLGNGLKALPRFQNIKNNEKAPLVIVLHGREGSEKGLLDIIPKNISARIFFLRGQIKHSDGGYLFFKPRLKEDSSIVSPAIEESATVIIKGLNKLLLTYPTSKVIVFGFSQGATISLYLGSIGISDISIAFSGALPKDLYPEQSQDSKIYIWHGTKDVTVPEKLDFETYKAFENQGFDVTYKTKKVSHVFPPQDVVKEYFNEALKE